MLTHLRAKALATTTVKLLWPVLFFCVFIRRLKHIAYIKLPLRHGQTDCVYCIRARSSNIPICADKLPLHIALFDELYAYSRGIECFFFFLKHDFSWSVTLSQHYYNFFLPHSLKILY